MHSSVIIKAIRNLLLDPGSRACRLHEFHQQPGEALYLDVLEILQQLARHLDALLEREERMFRAAVGNGEDDTIEQPRRAAHEVLVAERDRIESAWIDRGVHSVVRLTS